MFRQVHGRTVERLKSQCCIRISHRCYTTVNSSSRAAIVNNSPRNVALVVASISVFAGLYLHSRRTVHNDALTTTTNEKNGLGISGQNIAQVFLALSNSNELTTVAWGSNKFDLLSSNDVKENALKTGCTMTWLNDVALRDLALQEKYGVCVDVRGDVYKWSAGESPKLILGGKNISSLQLTPSRVFSLSSSGKIYSLPSGSDVVPQPQKINAPTNSSWYPWNWLSTGNPDSTTSTFNELNIVKDVKFNRNEKFVSISAGTDHLLALTSTGRTFVHPITANANAYGQLASRRFHIPTSSSSATTNSSDGGINLTPKVVEDPYANVSRFPRNSSSTNQNAQPDDKAPICDTLFEVQSLKGINIAQAVAGARSSYVRTAEEGRVLSWGANEFGQLGLGSTVTMNTVTVPTEVVLSRFTQAGTKSRCTNIITGGDLAFFIVERNDGTTIPAVDILGCGMGQWGGLGNGLFSTAQGNPLKVKNVSGLIEFSEETRNLQAIIPYAMSVSSAGHVLLTLDTLLRSDPESSNSGRDLFVWGQNKDYQLGTGKKSSIAVPTSIDTLDGGRLMMKRRKADVKDLRGRLWKRKVEVEQTAVAGYGSSIVYWQVC